MKNLKLIIFLISVFFIKLILHYNQLFYSDYSDLLAFHLPATRFLTSSWQQTGEIPKWNPYSFSGMPFVHDIQNMAFYPLMLPLYYLPEAWVGPALSWLVVAHVTAAGCCMLAYCYHRNLRDNGALVAAVGYMFAGKWMLHLLGAGQLMMIGLAWLPLVLLGLERAIRRASLLSASLAGVAYALIILGTTPQLTFYAGLFIAVWTLASALDHDGSPEGANGNRRRIGSILVRWLGYGSWSVLVALALAAVQLLPSLELASLTTRGAVGTQAHPRALEILLPLLGLVGPSPTGLVPGFGWETRSGVGILWATAALLAPGLSGGRVRLQGLVCLIFGAFASGGAVLVRGLPGFRLFQIPSRMFLILAIPVALFAGISTEALFSGPGLAPAKRLNSKKILYFIILFFFLSNLVLAVILGIRRLGFPAYWATLPATSIAAYWVLGTTGGAGHREAPRRRELVWCAALLADLWALAWPLVSTRAESAVYDPPRCVRYLAERKDEHGRVLAREAPGHAWGTPLGTALPLLLRIEAVEGYNPQDIYIYKKYINFVKNSNDLPYASYRVGNAPVENKRLLDLLGVRFLLLPSGESLGAAGDGLGSAAGRLRRCFDDPVPSVYSISIGGAQQLPPYTVFENLDAFPRAFVVGESVPMPDRSRVLQVLKTTDFRRRVILEGPDSPPKVARSHRDFEAATISEYQPNKIVVKTDNRSSGYLVLTDIWFPGWSCTVDGRPTRILRANFLFRSVPLSPGKHEIIFEFQDKYLSVGASITRLALLLGGLVVIIGATRKVISRLRGVGDPGRDSPRSRCPTPR